VVVEDAAIRSLVAELLEDEGYVVDTAGDGVQALQRARDAPPATILLDLPMPVLAGWVGRFVDAYRLLEITTPLKQLGVRAILANRPTWWR
jgi:CheY-like chemotaxis protein